MSLPWSEIERLALTGLSPEERESSVVYLNKSILPPDDIINIDRQQIRTPWQAVMAFIDLKPTANWAHDCRYLLINAETGEMQSINAHFPPFLKRVPETLKVIWKGEAVPHWIVAAR